MSYIRRAARNSTPPLPSHDKHESRKSRDGERFRSAAEASFQLDGVSRSVTAAAAPHSHATTLDSLMERCPSNCPRVIFCNRKQFHSATRVSTAVEICLPLPVASHRRRRGQLPGHRRLLFHIYSSFRNILCNFS